jgi:hypothetical protein
MERGAGVGLAARVGITQARCGEGALGGLGRVYGLKRRFDERKTGIPAGIIPGEYSNRQFGQENTSTDFAPVPTGFPGFFPVSCFS